MKELSLMTIPSHKAESQIICIGGWQFEFDGRWLDAESPGCIHTDLLRHGVISDPFFGAREKELAWIGERDWRYRASLVLPPTDFPRLVCHGLDTLAEVRLEGKLLGRTDNMFLRYEWDVSCFPRAKALALEILFRPVMPEIRRRAKRHDFSGQEWCDPVGGRSTLRKSQCNFGWDWGPRFLTCGLFGPVEILCPGENRIRSVRIRQSHHRGKVSLSLEPELEFPDAKARFAWSLSLGGKRKISGEGLDIRVPDPQLWWPIGHGVQTLYRLKVERLSGGRILDSWQATIGLRTIELDQSPDKHGRAFRFVVNGRPIFIKGANWIPAHVFPHGLQRADYEPLLRSAAAANMNMLRVWGGGIYEHEAFHDLCDELGLLVWQDFLFACALYPGDRAFLDSCRAEASQQVERLRHRASLALWSGNNEIEQLHKDIAATPGRRAAFEDLFFKILPDTVRTLDGTTPYLPGSPHNPDGWENGHNNPRAGDAHLWDVWHSRAPVETYLESAHRFVSEFGMQSFPHPAVAATFCAPQEFNILSPVFEAHQKNGGGNSTVLHYISQLYRFPRDYDTLAYLSQLSQAHCMRVAIEHFRRTVPRCMGALYWQLNDCWPAASWSSLEFGGRWKALHHEARRFFAPVLLSAEIPGRESVHLTSNTRTHTHRFVHWHLTADHCEPGPVEIRWSVFRTDGPRLRSGKVATRLRPDSSRRAATLDLKKEIAEHGVERLVVWAEARRGSRVLASNTALLCQPRLLELKNRPIRVEITKSQKGTRLELSSEVYHHRVELDASRPVAGWSDNFFDLLPGIPKTIEVVGDKTLAKGELRVRSLVQTAAR